MKPTIVVLQMAKSFVFGQQSIIVESKLALSEKTHLIGESPSWFDHSLCYLLFFFFRVLSSLHYNTKLRQSYIMKVLIMVDSVNFL